MSNDTQGHDTYITVEEAAVIAGLTTRQIHHLGEQGKLRRRKATKGKRMLYHIGDVQGLAADQDALNRPPPTPPTPKPELVPAGELLDYLRQRDEELRRSQVELMQLAAELGAVRNELGHRQNLIDQAETQAARLNERLSKIEQERDALQKRVTELEQQARPWWMRWRR